MEDVRILKTQASLNQNGFHITITTEDGSTYRLKDLDDNFLINVLKSKGYRVTKEF